MRESCVKPALHVQSGGHYFVTSSDYNEELAGPFPDKESAQTALDAMKVGINAQRNVQLTKLSVQIAEVALALKTASVNNQKAEVEKLSERLYTLEGCFAMIAGVSHGGPAFHGLLEGMTKVAGLG
jgi:hypothetical protein